MLRIRRRWRPRSHALAVPLTPRRHPNRPRQTPAPRTQAALSRGEPVGSLDTITRIMPEVALDDVHRDAGVDQARGAGVPKAMHV